jgi:hypothetical protein
LLVVKAIFTEAILLLVDIQLTISPILFNTLIVILLHEKTVTRQGLFEGFDCFDSKARSEKGSLLRSSMFYPELPPF